MISDACHDVVVSTSLCFIDTTSVDILTIKILLIANIFLTIIEIVDFCSYIMYHMQKVVLIYCDD